MRADGEPEERQGSRARHFICVSFDRRTTSWKENPALVCRLASPPDRREACRHHQAVALLGEVARFRAELEVVEPFRIGHHGGAPAFAVGGALVAPQMHECVELAALGLRVRERWAEVAHLRGKAVPGIEIEMGAGFALAGAIGANVDEHAVLHALELSRMMTR